MTRIRIHIPIKALVEGQPVSTVPIKPVVSPIFLGDRQISPAFLSTLEPSIIASIRVEAIKRPEGSTTKAKVNPKTTTTKLRTSLRAAIEKGGTSEHKFTDKPIVSVTSPEKREEAPKEKVVPVVASKTYMEAQKKAVVPVEVRRLIR